MHARPDRSTNRTLLLDAAASLLVERGYDQVTANAIAEAAGVSRGTLYGYFGDVAGVFASVWAEDGEDWLRRAFMDGATEWSELDTALATLFVVARRVPDLRDIVTADVERVWEEVAGTSPIGALRASYLLAGKVGLHLTLPVVPEGSVVNVMFPWCASLPDDASERTGITDAAPAVPDELPVRTGAFAEHDAPIADRLAAACMQVVASSGLADATLMRICRVARVSTGAASPRFGTLAELHAFAFERSLTEVIGNNVGQIRELLPGLSAPDLQATLARAALTESRRRWRTYRQEMLVASRHNPAVAELVSDSYRITNQSLHESFLSLGHDVFPEVADFVVLFNVVFSAGQAAVAELGVPIATMDHRPMIRWLYQQLTGSA